MLSLTRLKKIYNKYNLELVLIFEKKKSKFFALASKHVMIKNVERKIIIIKLKIYILKNLRATKGLIRL